MKDPIERADAIAALDDEITITGTANAFVVKDYVQRVLRKLRDLPSSQPPTDEWCTDCKEYDHERHCCPRFNRVIRETLEEVQPQRRPGRWIESNLVPSRKGKPDGRLFICSECNKGWVKQDRSMEGINFCPNCGADMRGGDQDG